MGGIGTETYAAAGAGKIIAVPVQFLDREAVRGPARRWGWRRRRVSVRRVSVKRRLRDGAARS